MWWWGKKKEDLPVKTEAEYTSGEIWGQVITLAYENREFAFHALVGAIAEWDRTETEVIGITHDKSLLKCFKDCGYEKLAKELMDELGYKSTFKLQYREREYTREEILDIRITSVCKNVFNTNVKIVERERRGPIIVKRYSQ